MKAISLWQPWASLMANRFKRIETRSWSTKYRGSLIIHAAKRPMNIIHQTAVTNFESMGIDWRNELPYKALLCTVILVDVFKLREENIELIQWDYGMDEIEHGDFRLGRFAWITKHLKTFKEPIPFRGRQRLFDVPDEIINQEIQRINR